MAKKPENTYIWEALSQTNPKYTKAFKRAGGFEGTAQNPTYAIQKMTEFFGPCGKGWGTGKPEYTFVNGPNSQVLVYCVMSVWYLDGGQRFEVWGVGGDSAIIDTKYGLRVDDEACKKSTTDALTNAMKQIGMAADIHLGMFDDSKYVNDIRKQFEKEEFEAAKKQQVEVRDNKIALLSKQSTQSEQQDQEIPPIEFSTTKEEFELSLSLWLNKMARIDKPERTKLWKNVNDRLRELTGGNQIYWGVLGGYVPNSGKDNRPHSQSFGTTERDLQMELTCFKEMWEAFWEEKLARRMSSGEGAAV
jgi:hypothetical protein